MKRIGVFLVLAWADCVTFTGQNGGAADAATGALYFPPGPTGYAAIAGWVVVEKPTTRYAVPFEEVGLYRQSKLLATASTDAQGRFRFLGVLPDSDYEVRLISDRFAGSVRVLLLGRPRRDVELPAQRL